MEYTVFLVNINRQFTGKECLCYERFKIGNECGTEYGPDHGSDRNNAYFLGCFCCGWSKKFRTFRQPSINGRPADSPQRFFC